MRLGIRVPLGYRFASSGNLRSFALIVEDDGIGFDLTQVDAGEHFGLQLMAERVEAGRGRFTVDSRLGEGTRVMVTLPPEI